MTDTSYWERIERYFAEKRGSALILSPKDWPLISSWEERRIPLEVIFEGIDQAFIRFEENQGTPHQHHGIRSLASCRYDVEEAWNLRKERDAEESSAEASSPNPKFLAERQKFLAKLSSAASQLRKYAEKPHYACLKNKLLDTSESLDSLVPQIEQVETQEVFAELVQQCRDIEQTLHEGLEETLDEATRQTLHDRAEAKLTEHKARMTAAAYRKTLRITYLQELRQAYPLPVLL